MAPNLTIGEVAGRTGFSPSALRYYDQLGLVTPIDRTAAGYRSYDPSAVARLAFIARTKDLGCALDEIRILLVAWDGGRCGPLQEELRDLVDCKTEAAELRHAELDALIRDLRRSRAALETHRPAGDCDEWCGCLATPVAPIAQGEVSANPIIACSLPARSIDGRVAEWQALLADVQCREELPDGVRLTFRPTVPTDALMRLVAAEQTCCAFLRFAITVDERGFALEVRSQLDGLDVIRAVFA